MQCAHLLRHFMLKGMSWHGGVFAPFDKGKLKAKQGIRFRTFATGWRYGWQSDKHARPRFPSRLQGSAVRLRPLLGRHIRKIFKGTTHFVSNDKLKEDQILFIR